MQRLANFVLALKKQLSQNSISTLYKDIPRRTYPNNVSNYATKNQNKLTSPLERLSLEAPPTNIIVGYFEVDQGDLPASEDDVATLF